MYKKYRLIYEYKFEGSDTKWKKTEFDFDTKDEMVIFVKEYSTKGKIRVEAAFKIEQLDNSIFI